MRSEDKNNSLWYFEFDRPEVRELIPRTAKSILDIGCGAGRLGEALKARQPATVVGIEFSPGLAELARTRIDKVFVGDVETMDPGFETGAFDAVICADVLEHLRDPGALLARIRTWLEPGGCLVASIPNVRHHSVVRSLLSGNWTYEPAGLLDSTHLRFFTRPEIEKLLYRAGFAIQEMQMVPTGHDDGWFEQVQAGTVKVGVLQLENLASADAQEFFVYQYLIRAIPAIRPQRGLTSIVIVTHNELRYTRQCLESIARFTDEPYELIVVDNGSSDETPDFLQRQTGLQVILNSKNRGFASAVNQGISASKGEQILLLNNDCVVATGWLDRMLDALDSDPTIGLVGPVTNSAHGLQKIIPNYDDVRDVDGFAWDWGQRHHAQRVDCEPLQGFCLLMRRQVLARVGLLDERFAIGGLEDDDYCLRVRQAGFRAVLAKDVFIHHYGHRTFLAAGIDFDAQYQKNLILFREKWSQADGSSRGRPNYGLTSIVILTHNQLEFTGQCVESIHAHTDEPYELIFVDNASTDGSLEYLTQVPNSSLIKNVSNRGFPAAANQGMKLAEGKQILLLNNDCVVPFGWLERHLRALYSNAEIGLAGACSNFVSGVQQIEATYQDMRELHTFAENWARTNQGQLVLTDRLIGFASSSAGRL